jgi:TetR/AcrR family transcriptional repressor of nem operon
VTKGKRTRQHIVEQTAPLFNTKGFEGTSLTDLTAATGLSKGALYGNFSDKEEIAMEAFKYSMNKVREMVFKKLEPAKSYKGQLLALLDFYAEYVFNPPVPGGCPLLNSAIESDDHHVTMRRVVVHELMRTIDFISGLIDNGVKAGEFGKTTDSRQMAYVFFCAVEGAIMFARVERSREPMDIIRRHCKKMLDQISQ